MQTTRWAAALACAMAMAAALPGGGRADGPAIEWRAARWGMSVDEVLAAFPGEAERLASPEALADGNVVAVGIERHDVGATTFRVRFVFDGGGRLALVSLRTDPKAFAGPEVFEATRAVLAGRLGPPAEDARDDNFIDMRQVTWRGARGRVDLKYVPGTVVILHAAPTEKPAGHVPMMRPELLDPRPPAASPR